LSPADDLARQFRIADRYIDLDFQPGKHSERKRKKAAPEGPEQFAHIGGSADRIRGQSPI
jgi:hypothetical protein